MASQTVGVEIDLRLLFMSKPASLYNASTYVGLYYGVENYTPECVVYRNVQGGRH